MKKLLIVAALAVLCAAPSQAQVVGSLGHGQTAAYNLATSQTAAGTTATLVAPARDTRQEVLLAISAANNCAVGAAGVTLATGYKLPAVIGASVNVRSRAALYVVCDVSTTVSVLDNF